MVKLDFKTDSQILYDIFVFYRDSICTTSLDSESEASLMNNFVDEKAKSIESLLPPEKDVILKDFKDKNFYSINAYSPVLSNKEIFRIIMNLAHIKHEIYMRISPEYRAMEEKYKDAGKLVRKISPNIEAYKFIPFNKMDIKYSKISYGLLFE